VPQILPAERPLELTADLLDSATPFPGRTCVVSFVSSSVADGVVFVGTQAPP
jgi:hypothetical protein